MPKLNPYIEKAKHHNQLKEHDTHSPEYEVDCCIVNNPYGFSQSVGKMMAVIHTKAQSVSNYSYNSDLKSTIADFWSKYASLDATSVILSNGAIDSIYMINWLFYQDEASILGISPQYTEYVYNARLLGYNYRSVPLLKKDSYKFDVTRMLDGITSDLSLIYIDSPHNPTGQAIPLNEIRYVLDKAMAHDICVVIDEAYGDYLEPEKSAATLLGRYDNLIVIRSFSKGCGLPGLRTGYMLANEYLAHNFDKISNPYVVSSISRVLAEAALLDISHPLQCGARFAESKKEIQDAIGGRLNMAHTLPSSPLFLMWHNDTTVNLGQEFGKRGIKVCSGSSFENLAANSARLQIPHHNQMKKLIAAINEIN